ncbi:hypothetical protein ABIA39_008560 [Nocardia sp. GAS34]|uniref:nuclear transport factor 2 family protein n=1 Tax=unclassified Nocardia TaxID=2637762 RepID=UPI003D25AEC1
MIIVRSELERFADEYANAWNTHNLDDIMSRHTQDTIFRLHLLGAPEIIGHADVCNAFAGLLTLGPDSHFAVQDLRCGPGFLVCQYVLTATLTVPVQFEQVCVEPTGRPIAVTGIDVLTMRENLVQCKDTYLDIAAALTRSGILR